MPTTVTINATANTYLGSDDPAYATAHSTVLNTWAGLSVGQKADSTYGVERSLLKFDTHTIPKDATIISYKLRLYVLNDGSDTDFDVVIRRVDWSSYDPVTVGNKQNAWDAIASGVSDATWGNTSGISNQYYDSNEMVKTWLNRDGYTYYALVSSRDLSSSVPSGIEWVDFGTVTGANPPMLVITYLEAGELPAAVDWPDHLNSMVGPFPLYSYKTVMELDRSIGEGSSSYEGPGLVGQTFTPDHDFVLRRITTRMWNPVNATDNVTCKLYATDTGLPVGNPLAISRPVFSTQIPASAGPVEFIFDLPYKVLNGVMYAFFISRVNDDPSNPYAWNMQMDTNLYAGGTYLSTISTSESNMTLWFQLSSGDPANAEALYTVLVDKTNNYACMMKSIDQGVSWIEVDAAHHAIVSPDAGFKSLYATIYGSYIYMGIVYKPTSSNMGSNAVFDMLTDTWGVNNTSGHLILNNITNTPPLFLAVRSDGTRVYLYNLTTERISGTYYRRVAYNVAGGGDLDPVVGQAGDPKHYDARICVLGANDVVHFLWTNPADDTFWGRTLGSDNILYPSGMNYSRSGFGYGSDNYPMGLPALRTINGSVYLELSGVSFTDYLIESYGLSQNVLSQSNTNIQTSDSESTASNPAAFVADGDVLYALLVSLASDDLEISYTGAGNHTWITPVSLVSGITCQGISANLITYSSKVAIGYLYNDNGTVKYGEYVLRYLNAQCDEYWKQSYNADQEVFAQFAVMKPGNRIWARVNGPGT